MAKKSGPKPRKKTRPPRARAKPFSIKALDALIADATVDAHDDDEQLSGFQCCLQDNVEVPFTTTVLGIPVQVTDINFNNSGDIVAICKSGKVVQRISLLELPLPNPPPVGHEWIEAFRRWRRLNS